MMMMMEKTTRRIERGHEWQPRLSAHGPGVVESANGTQAQHMKKERQSSFRLPWGVEAFIRMDLLREIRYTCVQMNASTARKVHSDGGH